MDQLNDVLAHQTHKYINQMKLKQETAASFVKVTFTKPITKVAKKSCFIQTECSYSCWFVRTNSMSFLYRLFTAYKGPRTHHQELSSESMFISFPLGSMFKKRKLHFPTKLRHKRTFLALMGVNNFFQLRIDFGNKKTMKLNYLFIPTLLFSKIII